LANNKNSTEVRIVKGSVAPTYISVTQSPDITDYDALDLGVNVSISANLSDVDNNFDTAIVQWKNSTGDWNNITMSNVTEKSIYTIVNATLTLPNYEDNITYRIWANGTTGEASNSSLYIIQSFWDCTWTLSTARFEEVSGFYKDKALGSVNVSNTGDSNYSGGCSLTFTGNYLSNSFSGAYYTSSFPSSIRIGFSDSSFSLTAKANKTVNVTGGFPSSSTVLQETPVISFTSNVNDTIRNSNVRYINATMIIASGAVLYQEMESPASTIALPLRVQNLSWKAYVRNLGGDDTSNNTAYNVSFNWSMSSDISNDIVTGNLTDFYNNLSDSSKMYNNLSIELTKTNLEAAAPSVTSPYNISIYARGYENTTGNLTLIDNGNNLTLLHNSVLVSFYCEGNDTDLTCPSSCNYLTDTACTQSSSGTASGGGGGGGGGGSKEKTVKSEAEFELLRGKEQEFELPIKNKYPNELKNLIISVSGLNSEYISISPTSIDSIKSGDTKSIRVKISAPAYFTGTKYILSFEIKGEMELNGSNQDFKETKIVTLYIIELSKEEADSMYNDSISMISDMTRENMSLINANSLFDKVKLDYDNKEYLNLKNDYNSLKTLYKNAFDSRAILEELKAGIAEAEKNGLNVDETKKLLYIAEVVYNRGDYNLAIERLKEAKLTYALEVKGEFNLISTVKNYPLQSLGIVILAGLVGTGSTLVIRLQLNRKKLKMLHQEEVLLLELMKVVQRECFEENRMSMEEYEQAMAQYENRLSETIEEKIKTETIIANILKIRGKHRALIEEKKRLVELIKAVQNDYLNKGSIETRVYENMLKSYTTRLSEVDEQLAFLDAQDALNKESKLRRMFRV